jgi:hypothetical protein
VKTTAPSVLVSIQRLARSLANQMFPTRFTSRCWSSTSSREPGAVSLSQISLASGAGIAGVLVVFLLAQVSGTDFTVSAPPAVTSPLPWWLFATYAVGAGAAMFLVVPFSQRFARPRRVGVGAVVLGLTAMTPAPFLVTEDFLTIFWLTASHVALVTPSSSYACDSR